MAASQFGGRWGHFVISPSELFSTVSAINATLFTGAQFSDRLIENGLLSQRFDESTPEEFEEGEDVPKRVVLVLGVLTTAFTVVGSLERITSLASLTFIVVFGGGSLLAFQQRDDDVSALPPAVGPVGTAVFLPLMLRNPFSTRRGVFYTVAGLAVVAVAVELLDVETDVFDPRGEDDPMVGD